MADTPLLRVLPILSLLLVLSPLVPATAAASHGQVGGSCHATGSVQGKFGHCKILNRANCCKGGETYPQYRCSPRVTAKTPATMIVNSFASGAMGSTGPCACDKNYHNDGDSVVALSTGWYNGGKRWRKNIRISGNGKTVVAKVVDECDSVNGCTHVHNFRKPCGNNVVDASPAVWKALGIHGRQYGITWSNA